MAQGWPNSNTESYHLSVMMVLERRRIFIHFSELNYRLLFLEGLQVEHSSGGSGGRGDTSSMHAFDELVKRNQHKLGVLFDFWSAGLVGKMTLLG